MIDSTWFREDGGRRVLEPACFGAAPAPGIFYPELAPAPGKREHNFGFFLTDYELCKIGTGTF